MKKLTEKHIEELYTFTRQHYVEHYDVQTELVDHLANDIEQIWKNKPQLSFEKARDISFKKFGVFGFMGVVEEKQKQLGKKYRKILWKYTKEWFEFPKILTVISTFLFFYYFLQLNIGIYMIESSLFLLAIIDLYFVYKLKKEFNKKTRTNGKKWMLEEMIFNVASIGGIMVAANLPQILTYIERVPSKIASVIIATMITLAIIYSYVTLVVIPKKSEKLLQKHYPEYKLISS